MKDYLFRLANEHVSFRIPELQSIIRLFDIPATVSEVNSESPWIVLQLPSEDDAKKILSRSVSAMYCLELWGRAKSKSQLHTCIRSLPASFLEQYASAKMTFRIDIDPYNKTYSASDKINIIEEFAYLALKGRVNLQNPDCHFYFIEDFGMDPNAVQDEAFDLFFGRLIGRGQREAINKLSLRTRKFIGNTSMDPQLSLIMSNLACVKSGSLVIDPFVGTGSLLVSSAHFGAQVFGTDIDYLMIHGKTKPTRAYQKKREDDEKIVSNMEQYGLKPRFIDVCVADASRNVWRSGCRFDAIVTDPPYGIREGSAKVGSRKQAKVPESCLDKHHPSKIQYSLANVCTDLLKFAGRHLEMHGRLVFWLPVYRLDYNEDRLPRHPCLKLIVNCEQTLASHTSRRLLVMEKISEPESAGDEEIFVDEVHSTFSRKYFEGALPETQLRLAHTEASKRRSKKGHGRMHTEIVRQISEVSLDQENAIHGSDDPSRK